MDQLFIRDIETNPRHRAIVRTITSFADELGLTLTAAASLGSFAPGVTRDYTASFSATVSAKTTILMTEKKMSRPWMKVEK